jgi:hypothetical protein
VTVKNQPHDEARLAKEVSLLQPLTNYPKAKQRGRPGTSKDTGGGSSAPVAALPTPGWLGDACGAVGFGPAAAPGVLVSYQGCPRRAGPSRAAPERRQVRSAMTGTLRSCAVSRLP